MRQAWLLFVLLAPLACSHKTGYEVPAWARFDCPSGTHPQLGSLGAEIFRTCVDKAGVRDGPFVSWYRRTGIIGSKKTYRHGEFSGVGTNYHPNGKKLSEGKYVDGVRDGEWRLWDEHGTLEAIQTYDAELGGKLVDEKDFPAPGRDP